MNIDQVILRRWYIALASVSTLAAVVAVVFPRWPRAEPLNAAALNSHLKSSGFQVQQLPSRPPTRTYDLASSHQLIWKLPNNQELSLMRATSREYINFQVAFLARAQPSLKIKKRQLFSTPLPLAKGFRNSTEILQTCIIPARKGQKSGIGVIGEQLAEEQTRLTFSLAQRISSFFLWTPSSRNSCVVMTLTSPRSSSGSNLSLFKNLVNVMTTELASQSFQRSRSTSP
ncbi:MAG: hypothetical protein ACK52U_12805 [Synechococcaceae cyanobacterium]